MSNDFFYFRTEFFRLRLPIYKVASEVDLHPSRLSLYLNGRLPMNPELMDRLLAVVKEHHPDV
jgi:hypothetical protein